MEVDLLNYIEYFRWMQTDDALAGLAALSHPTRLDAFRLLVRHEPLGLPTGSLVEASGLSQSTFSTHLAVLGKAGLVTAEKHVHVHPRRERGTEQGTAPRYRKITNNFSGLWRRRREVMCTSREARNMLKNSPFDLLGVPRCVPRKCTTFPSVAKRNDASDRIVRHRPIFRRMMIFSTRY